jgi:hypothetical protein
MNVSPARLRWLYLRGPYFGFGVAFTLFGGMMVLVVAYGLLKELEFRLRAVRTVATVTAKESRIGRIGKGGPQTIHELKYTYPDSSGHEHESKVRVTQEYWQRTQKGDALDVEYAANDPGVNRTTSEYDTRPGENPLVLGLMSVLFSLYGIVFMIYSIKQSGLRARIVREGVPALGVVEALVTDDDVWLHTSRLARVAYHFTDAAGTTWKGRGWPQQWTERYPWAEGDTILILYDPRDPRRNEADIFNARADDLAKVRGQDAEKRD